MPASTMRKPTTSEIGKPTANRFSVGAARLTTPKARLTISNAVTPGSAMEMAPANSWPPQRIIIHRPSRPRPSMPMGSVVKPWISTSIKARWPPSARKVSVASTM